MCANWDINAWETVIDQFDNCANRIFTLGPNNAITIENYANLIAGKLNWDGKIIWHTKSHRPGEIYILNSSEQDLFHATGWKPKIDLSDGIDMTIKIWKNHV